ncbi:MAG: hypothetical protein C4523_17910 [Myxococcales bacterium]|nr:MAG: hypothetical protein C4523_17910 [Myxococcales bacterium]
MGAFMKKLIILIATVWICAACLPDNFGVLDSKKGDFTREEAIRAYREISGVVVNSSVEAMLGLINPGGETKEKESSLHLKEDGSFTGARSGPEGGEAICEGQGDVQDGRLSVGFGTNFEAYGQGGLVFEGFVDYAYSGVIGQFAATVEGDINVEGDLKGQLNFSLTITWDGDTLTTEGKIGEHDYTNIKPLESDAATYLYPMI